MAFKYIIFPFLLSILSYFGEYIYRRYKNKKIESKLFSFASGILITFLFLGLLPDLFYGTKPLAEMLYIFVLLGFTTFLLIHEILYKYEHDKKMLKFELRESHVVVSFSFHFIIGMVIYELIKYEDLLSILIIFIPIAIHIIFSSLASHHIIYTKNYQKSKFDKFLEWGIILAPTLGALFVILFPISQVLTYALYGVIGGIMLFIIIRELIPKPKEAHIGLFILGQLLYLFLILIRFLS